jgi:hypothetical protein
MPSEARALDISNTPDLLRLAEEVRETNEPRLLTRNGEELAVIMPIKKPRRRRKSGVIRRDDPIFKMAGLGDSGIPGGISWRKYDYFKKAFGIQEPNE